MCDCASILNSMAKGTSFFPHFSHGIIHIYICVHQHTHVHV